MMMTMTMVMVMMMLMMNHDDDCDFDNDGDEAGGNGEEDPEMAEMLKMIEEAQGDLEGMQALAFDLYQDLMIVYSCT